MSGSNSAVTMVDVRRRRLVLNHTEEVGYDRLISTLPLPELVKAIPDAPRAVVEAAAGLVNVPLYCVNLGIDRPDVSDKHWIYYPEHDYIFQRAFVQSNASPQVRPDGTSSLTLEISHSPYKPVSRDTVLERAIEDTVRAGLLTADDRLLAANVLDLSYAYPVSTPERARQVDTVRQWLRRHDIHIAGRFAEWEYYNSDGAILAGRRVANEMAATLLTPAQVSLPVPALPGQVRQAPALPTGPAVVPAVPRGLGGAARCGSQRARLPPWAGRQRGFGGGVSAAHPRRGPPRAGRVSAVCNMQNAV